MAKGAALYDSGLRTFLSEDHISYFTKFRGPDTLLIAIVSGYATFYQINTYFVKYIIFFIFAAG